MRNSIFTTVKPRFRTKDRQGFNFDVMEFVSLVILTHKQLVGYFFRVKRL